jgi:hypothetical protein
MTPLSRRKASRQAAERQEGGPAERTNSAAFAAAFLNAFEQLDRQKGSHNFVKLVDLRGTLAAYTREEFDRGLRDLRLAGRYELAGAESVGGLRPEEQAAGIEEAGSLLLYVSRRLP